MTEMFTIGKIVNTHGVKGEMRVKPSTDDIKRFEKLKEIQLEVKGGTKTYELTSVRYHKDFVLIKLKGIETMDDAELLKNTLIRIDRKDSLPLSEDEYYQCDLYDLEVMTEEGRNLGILTDIIITGSNDVYVVTNPETKKEILLPAIKQCIKKVDIANRQMIVHLMKGLEE